jgi:hypothetical protein
VTASLNLTLKRGPSVWGKPRNKPASWRIMTAATGVVITAFAMQSSPSRRGWLASLGLATVFFSLVGGRLSSTVQAGARGLRIVDRAQQDHVVDRASEDSFPASDPPALA